MTSRFQTFRFELCGIWRIGINRNPLHDIPSHFSPAPVIQPGRSWVGMISQVLHVFKRYTLGQQVCDGCHSK